MKRQLLLLSALLCSAQVYAEPPLAVWKCYSFDYYRKSYDGIGKTVRLAMKDARKNCVQHSKKSHSCVTAQSYCEQGPLSNQEDRCIAVDGSGKSFNATGPEACDVAMTICNDWQFVHGNSQRRHCSIVHR